MVRCARLAKDALDQGMSVVIGLQSTGEAALNAKLAEDELEELQGLISAPRVRREVHAAAGVRTRV